MTLWNAGRLADELRAGRVPERDRLRYLLVGAVMGALLGRSSLLDALRGGQAGAAPTAVFTRLRRYVARAAGARPGDDARRSEERA
jgi:hypothetical protein